LKLSQEWEEGLDMNDPNYNLDMKENGGGGEFKSYIIDIL
jgi:hypothetical protein